MAGKVDIRLAAQCFCKSATFSETIPAASLPLQTGVCHCTSCRRVTGAMFTCLVSWFGPHQEIWDSSLKRFAFTKNVTFFSCPTCSCLMFVHFPAGIEGDEERFEVCAGVLPNLPDVELIRIRDNLFVDDTLDGGATIMLRRPNADGELIPSWKGFRNHSEQIESNWPTKEDRSEMLRGPSLDKLAIGCKCGGVKLALQSGKDDFAAMKAEDLPFFVDPTTYKLLASCDSCNSCRLTSGTTPMYWISALLKHMLFRTVGDNGQDTTQNGFPDTITSLEAAVKNSSDNLNQPLGSLSVFASSKDARRFFCSNCSASIFYTTADRPDVVDIAVGVLQSPDGARAEQYLTWNYGMMGYTEDVAGGWRDGLVASMKKDAEEWRIERDIPKCFRRIVKEQQITEGML